MARRPYTGRTTSAFGPRLAPIKGASTFHQGVDGIGGYNTAPEGGTIVGYSYAGGWGNRIVFQGDSGTVHYLAHNAPGGLLGRVGKWYPEGTALGIKGMTGTATGVHVHWETRPGNGAPIDPERWLRSQGGTAGGGAKPITPERERASTMATVYYTTSNDKPNGQITQWAKAGDSPGTPANWLVTKDQNVANGWASTVGGSSVFLGKDSYATFRDYYLAPVKTTAELDSAAIADAVGKAVAAALAKLPTAEVSPVGGGEFTGTVKFN